MDPNLFHLDWDRTFEALGAVIVLSFFVERAASLLYETKFFALNTKIPQDGSPQALAEQAAATLANDILVATTKFANPDLADDAARDAAAKAVATLTKDLTPANPLWPVDPTDPGTARRQAAEVLADLRRRQERRRRLRTIPLKEAGAFVLAWAVVAPIDFDAFAIVLLADHTGRLGIAMTAAIIAGGSKASIKLFQDVFNTKSGTVDAMLKPKDNQP